MNKPERRLHRGFTLIELMIVVSIIGILSSIAIPEYQNFTLRARIAEREPIMRAIAKAVEDYALNAATLPATFQGLPNPVAEDQANTFKHPWAQATGSADNWRDLPLLVDGSTYCTYSFVLDQAVAPVKLYVKGNCDIDGDTVHNVKLQVYEGYGNAFVLNPNLSVESESSVF